MTNSNELDTVSNSWDQHSPDEHGGSPSQAVTQVAQAAQAAPAEPVPVDVGSGAPVKQDAPAEAKAPAAAAPHEYVADASNVVKLPANVSIDNIKVDGHNLVLEQADGSVIVIKDGALNVPTFIIGDVEVPRVALLAALEASHVDVAFGADGSISAGPGGSNSSAGGDFSVPPGGIGDGFDLSALLPPTALQFGLLDRRELFPSVVDRPVSVVATSLLTPDQAASETGIDGGPSQSPGSDAPSSAETSGIGTITIDAPDGIGSIVINGVTVTGVGQQILGDFGYLTIVSYNPSTGAIEYNYTVTESVTHPIQGDGFNPNDTVPDNFSITVTDVDGDTASTTFAVAIVDDVPTAVADTDSIAAAQFGPATGNVLVGGTDAADANTTDGVADTKGADGAAVVGVAAGNTNAAVDDAATLGTQIQGAYGKLTLAADGTYSYVRDAGTPGGVNDVFTYTIKDGDGDTSHTTLTISIGDGTPTVSIPVAGGADTTVYEAGLPARAGEPSGSNEPATSETTSGTIGFTSPDGLTTVSLGGHVLTGIPTAFADGTTGTLTASYVYNPATGLGTISYSYTLIDNTLTDPSSTSFAVVVTDADGDPAPAGNLVINIVDDVPTAVADTNGIIEGGLLTVSAVAGVLANDVAGADDFSAGGGVVGARAAGGDTTTAVMTGVGTSIAGLHGTLTLEADGSYTYQSTANAITSNTTDTFVYTIMDGDGDLSTTTLTINLSDSGLAASNDDLTVNEAALPIGSNPSSTAETIAGTVVDNVSGGTGPYTYALLSSATGVHGTLTFNANGTYSYTLTSPVDGLDANNGANTVNNVETFTYQATDANGNTITNTITIDVIDDVPSANSNTNSGVEGAIVTGNVLTDATDDVFGADGAAAGGGVVGVRVAGGDTTTAVTTGINTAINGSFGTLTLQANGTYSYDGLPNVVPPAGATETFVYTIMDGDGDLSTTTLTINLSDSGLAASN
ncbi:VCBS domain-containing protein, partial [Mesorhizobium sp. M0025]|uniref:beta strand repeat-containing protein n=1 Tax=Mesorhizobium sp. M0025 TaxID=2956846 RepID=UPI003335DEDF